MFASFESPEYTIFSYKEPLYNEPTDGRKFIRTFFYNSLNMQLYTVDLIEIKELLRNFGTTIQLYSIKRGPNIRNFKN